MPCKDLYAFITERSLSLICHQKKIGLIVPISIFGVDRFVSIQQISLKSLDKIWISCYSNRPSQLFDGAQKRLTILIGESGRNDNVEVYTTKYYRWRKSERDFLFLTIIEYIKREYLYAVFEA